MSHPDTDVSKRWLLAFGMSSMLCATLVLADENKFCSKMPDLPAIPATAKQADMFIPKGWRIDNKKVIDLDGDGIKDVAIVAESIRPWPGMVVVDGEKEKNTDLFHRWVIVLKGERSGFSLWANDPHLLDSNDKSDTSNDMGAILEASPQRLVFGVAIVRGGETAEFKLNPQHQWALVKHRDFGVDAVDYIEETSIDFAKGIYSIDQESIDGSTPKRKLKHSKSYFQFSHPLILGKDCLYDLSGQYGKALSSGSQATAPRKP